MTLTVEQAKQILRERYDFFTSNVNAGNIEKAVTEYYTEGAYVTGHETPLVTGHAQVVGLFEEIHETFKDMNIELVDTRVVGDQCIYSLVTATSRLADTGESASIKSMLVWRRSGDEWRCDADIFAMGGF